MKFNKVDVNRDINEVHHSKGDMDIKLSKIIESNETRKILNTKEQDNDDKINNNSRIESIYNLDNLTQSKHPNCFHLTKNKIQKYSKNKRKRFKYYLFKRLPLLEWTSSYKFKEYLLPDLMSGITVGIMNIPQVNFYFEKLKYQN